MQYTYRCRACHAGFTSRRRHCEYCETVGARTDRTNCGDCGWRLTDSSHQRCPVCGSGYVERVAVVGRE